MIKLLRNGAFAALVLAVPSLASAAPHPLNICANATWSKPDLDAVPDQVLDLLREVQKQYTKNGVTGPYPKDIDLKPLLDSGALEKKCGILPTLKKAHVQIHGDHEIEGHKGEFKAVAISTHNMSEQSCHTLLLNKKISGLLGYFSEINVNGQPVVLGSDDSFYECDRFGKNSFTFVSRF